MDNNDQNDKSKKPAEKERPVLKLASFADMSSNGISASDSISDESGEETCVTGKCSLCEKEIKGYKSAVVWETMQFCDSKCLSKYSYSIYLGLDGLETFN